MSSAEPDFQVAGSSQDSSNKADSRSTSRQESAPFSPRKRPRSVSADTTRGRKRHLDGQYNNAYRTLVNETVDAAAARFEVDESFLPEDAQIGAAKWSAQEKSTFFAALERLGRDNIAGIATAIRSKSMQEVQQYIQTIQDALLERLKQPWKIQMALEDIPAALEVGFECEDRLELAGDALAWYQERFEAKQEKERFGEYWLITPQIAKEIEDANNNSGDSDPCSSSPAPGGEGESTHVHHSATIPQTSQNLPEAILLVPENFLLLSRHFFMNPYPSVAYPWPHWTECTTELAAEPSLYRTAFNDFHALVVSLTTRLVQAAIFQATSRIRSQGWRVAKGVLPNVKRRDVVTAIDLIGLSRNGSKRWEGVARRCGLRVEERWREGNSKRRREVPWDEVEQILDSGRPSVDTRSTDAETASLTSGTDEEGFKSRALRTGTPLPRAGLVLPTDIEEADDLDMSLDNEDDEQDSNTFLPEDQSVQNSDLDTSELAHSQYDLPRDELKALEDFDQAAGQEEMRRLWAVLGLTAFDKPSSPQMKEESKIPDTKVLRSKIAHDTDDWRAWTRYRADWEELDSPVPLTSFVENQREKRPINAYRTMGHGTGSESETDRSFGTDVERQKPRRPSRAEIPLRGARAYAALQERHSIDEAQAAEFDASDDLAQVPLRSIEDADGDAVGSAATNDYNIN